jgi:Pectate lyase superfamily protein
VAGRWRRIFDQTVSIKWFGAKGDMKEYYAFEDKPPKPKKTEHYKGKIEKDSRILHLTSSDATGFIDSDNGKTIVIWKTGVDEVSFITTINKFVDEKNVELADIAPKDMSDAFVAWGTDDTNAIQHAIDVTKETGLTVYLPPGHFIITTRKQQSI